MASRSASLMRCVCPRAFSEENPTANVYTQSLEIKQALPAVVEAAAQYGYPVDRMAISGGSAGGCLALLYARRDTAIRDISALAWVSESSASTVLAYGAHDRGQSVPASARLDAALTAAGVDHHYIVFEHSGHGLQNDDAQMLEYYRAIEEYLQRYMG